MIDEPINWRSLHKRMKSFNEEELVALLDEEITTHRRPIIAERLHQRLCKLRASRERAAIMLELS